LIEWFFPDILVKASSKKMTEPEDIRDKRRFSNLKRIMDKSSTLDDFIHVIGRKGKGGKAIEPTATQVRLFIKYKQLVERQEGGAGADRWIGGRYITDYDLENKGYGTSDFLIQTNEQER
jgi:hypothetical protein